jgi:hypothetical protein
VDECLAAFRDEPWFMPPSGGTAMTEQEWLACTDPQAMLDFMFEQASRRKIELYTSGCYRSVWHLLTDERFRNKMTMRDRYFDGLATEEELDLAIKAADDVPHQLALDAWDSISPQRHREILRDLFGNPFQPVALNPSWRTPTVLALAQEIYDSRAFNRLPALANALEEAGCRDADLLAHCRGAGPHVKGCWAVDLLLGKE